MQVERRSLDLRDAEAVATDIQNLARVGYVRAGRWSLGQICLHLAQAMEQSVHGPPIAGPQGCTKILSPLILRIVLAKRKIPEGGKAPPEFVPLEQDDTAEIIERCCAAAREVQTVNTFGEHPFFGVIKAEQYRELHWIHASHHLSFLVPKQA